MSKQILVLGSINADHMLQLDTFPAPGQTLTGKSYRVLPGGKGANQAVACGRSGGNVRMRAVVGDDEFGQNIIQHLSDEGIETEAIVSQEDIETGVALIFVNGDGENMIGIAQGANSYCDEHFVNQSRELIEQADYLLLQQEIPSKANERAIDIAQSSQTYIVLNPAPARAIADSVLSKVNLITPNQTEAAFLTGVMVSDLGSATSAANILHDKGVSEVVITMGSMGAYLSSKREGYPQGMLIPAFPVKTVDTTAAGDAFNGALITSIAEGCSLVDAAFFASASAALSVMRSGSQASIPYRFEVEEFMQII